MKTVFTLPRKFNDEIYQSNASIDKIHAHFLFELAFIPPARVRYSMSSLISQQTVFQHQTNASQTNTIPIDQSIVELVWFVQSVSVRTMHTSWLCICMPLIEIHRPPGGVFATQTIKSVTFFPCDYLRQWTDWWITFQHGQVSSDAHLKRA